MLIIIITTHLANVIERKNTSKQPNVLKRKGGGNVLGKIFLFFEKIGCARPKNLQIFFLFSNTNNKISNSILLK